MTSIKTLLAAGFASLVLAGCNGPELGYEVDEGGFGNATMNNTQVHNGERSASLALAQQGAKVALVSSGDSGIYGMAGLAMELWLQLPSEPIRT